MSGKEQTNIKLEYVTQTQEAPEPVAANVTVLETPTQRTEAPLVIAPMSEASMAGPMSSQFTLPANALQTITSLLQGTSQGNLNITDYINTLVGQAAAQEPKGYVAPTFPVGALPFNIQGVSNLPTLANAVEGLFSLAPAMLQSPVIAMPRTIKIEQAKGDQSNHQLPPLAIAAMGEGSSLLEFRDSFGEEQLSPLAMSDDLGASAIKKRRGQPARARDEKLICLVCGDKALGCNFDAVSCESCKAFFRRNALKDKKGKCLFEGSCKIDVNTRRFCPFCRLEKCFTVGMKKEYILSEDAKRKRSQKQKEPHNGGLLKEESGPLSPPPTPNPPAPPTPNPPAPPTPNLPAPVTPTPVVTPVTVAPIPTPTPTQLQQLTLPSLSIAQNAGIQSVITNLTPSMYTIPTPAPTQITLEIPAGSTESVNLLSLSRFVKTTENFNVPMDSYLVRRLTVEESSMLQELMQIYDLSFTVDLEPLVHIKQVDPSLNQLVNQSSITVLRIIKFAKRLEEFVRLPQECQIGILKGCWIHMLLLRSVSAYDNERDLWVTPRGEIPTDILKNATGFDRLHDDHVNYCKSIKSIIKDDLTIVVLLIVTALFAPEGPHVVTRELVSNIQDKYLVLLKHYLESKYMYGRAAEMFPQLMSKMKELKELAEDHGKYLLDVNPNEIEPIMLEILDLK